MILIPLCIAILELVALWKVFEKAGQPGWKCLIPLYNTYIMYKISWGNGWFFLLLLIPIVNFVIGIMMLIKLANVFGKGSGFAVGLIFLSPIFIPILAFGDAQYSAEFAN